MRLRPAGCDAGARSRTCGRSVATDERQPNSRPSMATTQSFIQSAIPAIVRSEPQVGCASRTSTRNLTVVKTALDGLDDWRKTV